MTKIEWTDETWNPFTGCTKVSIGCDNCYAEKMWPRLTKMNKAYAGRKFSNVQFHPERLEVPFRWKKPRKIFVCSMGDLFHERNSFEQIASVYGVMASCPQHTFQVLTKRPDRALEFYDWIRLYVGCTKDAFRKFLLTSSQSGHLMSYDNYYQMGCNWPLPNLWIGVTAENQDQLDKRLSILFQIPASKYFVSMEPLLSEISFRWAKWITIGQSKTTGHLDGLKKLDWVIAGGETGHKARPIHPDWVRSIRDQCKETGTPFFFKGWGEWALKNQTKLLETKGFKCLDISTDEEAGMYSLGRLIYKFGKSKSGSLLDGVEYKQFPKG